MPTPFLGALVSAFSEDAPPRGATSIAAIRAASPTLNSTVNRIEDALAVARAAVDGASERYEAARRSKKYAEADFERDQQAAHAVGKEITPQSRAQHEARQGQTNDELQRWRKVLDEANTRLRAVMATRDAVVAGLAAYAARGGATDAAPVKISRGENLLGVRERHTARQGQVKSVNAAFPPPEVRRQMAEKQVTATARVPQASLRQSGPRRGELNVEYYLESAGASVDGNLAGVTSAAALICWAMPQVVVEEIARQLDAQAAGHLVLSAEEKEAQLSRLNAEMLALERIEAAMCIEALAAGRTDVWFSKWVRPAAILGVEI